MRVKGTSALRVGCRPWPTIRARCEAGAPGCGQRARYPHANGRTASRTSRLRSVRRGRDRGSGSGTSNGSGHGTAPAGGVSGGRQPRPARGGGTGPELVGASPHSYRVPEWRQRQTGTPRRVLLSSTRGYLRAAPDRGLLRPRQDDHRQVQHARLQPSFYHGGLINRRAVLRSAYAQFVYLARRRRPRADGPHARVPVRDELGVGRRPGAGDRRRDPARADQAVDLRRGGRH